MLVDEVYRDIWFEEAPPSHVHLGPHVLATSSLTKSYGLSGLRCGWVLALAGARGPHAPRQATSWRRWARCPARPWRVAAFRQLDRLAEREPRRSSIPTSTWSAPSSPSTPTGSTASSRARSMTVFPRLRKEEDSEPLHDWLRGRETSIVPGRFFEAPRHFRLGFAVRTEDVAQGLGELVASAEGVAAYLSVTQVPPTLPLRSRRRFEQFLQALGSDHVGSWWPFPRRLRVEVEQAALGRGKGSANPGHIPGSALPFLAAFPGRSG